MGEVARVVAVDAASSEALAAELAGRRARNRRRLVAVAVHLALLALWEVAVRAMEVPEFMLPAPSAIAATLVDEKYRWLANAWVTGVEIAGGYALATALGVAVALLFSWSPLLAALLFPLLVTLNMIPKVALGPLMIVWFSYGIGTNVLITFSLCFFPILLTTIRGLREVEPDLLDLVRSLRGTRWQTFRYIQFPGALPYLFSGMKVAAILAVAGAVVGEFIASDRGLGYLMIQVQASMDTPAMFMAVTLITLIGIALYGLVILVEHLMLPSPARSDA